MIEKLVIQKLTIAGKEYIYPDTTAIVDKFNETIDVINTLIEENNIHEEQIDELQMKLEPEKCKTPAENVPGPIKLYVCPDGSVYDNEDVAKSHTASIFNPSPAGVTTTDRVYLEQELERTRKALDVAVDALKSAKTRLELINNSKFANLNNVLQIQSQCEILKIEKSLEQITAPEQKDK